MGLQFDVYRNISGKTREYQPYFMIVQHDYYQDLSTRLILPLSYCNTVNRCNHPITPLINLDFQTFFLNPAGMTYVEKSKLNKRHYVCNLRSARNVIIAAIDALITNT